jgi:hypothetical protein
VALRIIGVAFLPAIRLHRSTLLLTVTVNNNVNSDVKFADVGAASNKGGKRCSTPVEEDARCVLCADGRHSLPNKMKTKRSKQGPSQPS